MILHLLTDDKFADYVIAQFADAERRSSLVLIPSNNAMGLVHHVDQCQIVHQNSVEFEDLLNSLDQYSSLILHGLMWGRWQTKILQRVPKQVKVAWYFWGGEIYSRQDVKNQFLAPITRVLYRLHEHKKRSQRDTSWEIPYELFKRIDYCFTSIPEEYEFARKYLKSPIKFIWYTYYSLEDTIGSLIDKRCDGNNIWIGNSAAEWNNHFDALWLLWRRGFVRKQDYDHVILPLSYGSLWVRNLVIKIGHLLFGNRMLALTDFMPREEYNSLMLSCSTMIINYYEPAAQGNIITGLWLGMRIYLSDMSLAYAYYKRIGANVYSLESDLKKYQFTPLSEEERAQNREVLQIWYGKQHVMEAVQNVVHALQ